MRSLACTLLMALSITSCQSPTPSSGSQAAAAPSGDVLPFQAVEHELANGLRVIVVPTGYPNLVSLQIPVQTGARNEVEPGKTGFAHFFEHMMFRGTRSYPPEKYQEIITKAGARQNAYTSDDYTNYHITFAKEDLEEILKIEADRFQHLEYPLEAFQTEARAVLGEYNKNSANPINKLDEVQREKAYRTHTYKHTAMGFLPDIEDMPNQFEYSRVFFDRWYRPERTTIILVGDVNSAEVLPMVERYWSSWKRGSASVEIPAEPAPTAPVYAHVPWQTPTLPWVTVAFHGPAFSESEKEYAATSLLCELMFGSTSDLYQQLVVRDQLVDALDADVPASADPSLTTAYARVKDAKNAVVVRDALLKAFAMARSAPLSVERVEAGKKNLRYRFARTLDNSESIGAALARFVRHNRSFQTLNRLYAVYASLTPQDLHAAAQRYFQDSRLVVTTLSHEALPAGIDRAPGLASLAPKATDASAPEIPIVALRSPNRQLTLSFCFLAGSACDPPGKEGLAALAASMLTEGGSSARTIEEIRTALFPVAGSFGAQVDREMLTLVGSIHRDNLDLWLDVALPQLLAPGFRQEDFQRLLESQRNALIEDLRSSNDEELGKERLQSLIFTGTPYGHPTLGTVESLGRITLDDVKQFLAQNVTTSRLTLGLAGDAPAELAAKLRSRLASLGAGTSAAAVAPKARAPQGIEVEIVQKDTRATAISFGHPIEVTRAHPDFAALSVARAWLGEHRSSMSHLYQRIREIRGMNYGDYAYIEAFPRGMFQFFPDANLARRAQIFEIWIRPVPPEQAHHALRIAIHELRSLLHNGLSKEDFETTRAYLMKNVYLLTGTQPLQLGYALDSRFYGIGDFAATMRERLAKLTLNEVNGAIRKHLSGENLHVVCITKDAAALKQALVSDAPSSIEYSSKKPAELLSEDAAIGKLKLGIPAEKVRITPVEQVFAR